MGDELDDGLAIDVASDAGSDAGGDAGGGAEGISAPSAAPGTAAAAPSAAARRRAKQKLNRRKRALKGHERTSAERELATQPATLQADYICAQQRDVHASLSALELDEVRVSEHQLIETVGWAERTAETLPAFLQRFADVPMDAAPGAPRIVVVCGNAQRAADLVRPLRKLIGRRPDATVAKLFARHFKADAQGAWLREHRAPLAVGTPHRLRQLLDSGALSLADAAALVIDHSWTDQKGRTIFDGPETRTAVVDLIGAPAVRAALRRGQGACRIVLF